MKQLLLFFALFANLTLNAQPTPPTVFYDSVLGHDYVYLQPTTWIHNESPVTRLYVWTVYDNNATTALIAWELRDSLNINLSPSSHVIASGTRVYLGDGDYNMYYSTQWPDDTYLFYFMAQDSLNPAYLNLPLK